jgi:hypothetical protein
MMSLGLGDWPGGELTGFECVYPDAPDGGIDLVLPAYCPRHARSWYWCPNASVVWCDGGRMHEGDTSQVHVWSGECAEP